MRDGYRKGCGWVGTVAAAVERPVTARCGRGYFGYVTSLVLFVHQIPRCFHLRQRLLVRSSHNCDDRPHVHRVELAVVVDSADLIEGVAKRLLGLNTVVKQLIFTFGWEVRYCVWRRVRVHPGDNRAYFDFHRLMLEVLDV